MHYCQLFSDPECLGLLDLIHKALCAARSFYARPQFISAHFYSTPKLHRVSSLLNGSENFELINHIHIQWIQQYAIGIHTLKSKKIHHKHCFQGHSATAFIFCALFASLLPMGAHQYNSFNLFPQHQRCYISRNRANCRNCNTKRRR